MTAANASDAAALADVVERLSNAKTVDLTEDAIFVVPARQKLQSMKPFLDELRQFPERVTGTTKLLSLESFIAHTNRFKTAQSTVFADSAPDAPGLTAVFDYHHPGTAQADARWGQHRASYAFPISEEWAAWTNAAGRNFSQEEFASFVEDHLDDVDEPLSAGPMARRLSPVVEYGTASALLAAARRLHTTAETNVLEAVNTTTGAHEIRYAEDVRETGAVKVPGAVLLELPVFRDGLLHQLGVRIKRRIKEGRMWWKLEPYRADRVFKHAFTTDVARVADETGCHVVYGVA